MKTLIAFFLLISGVPANVQEDDASRHAIDAVGKIVQQIEACPERVAVAQSKSKWFKNSWGPPFEAKYDIERTNSILYPFAATVEFSLAMKGGKNHSKREEAETDNDLRLELTARYRNIYKIANDFKLSLDSRQVFSLKNAWEERPAWADACWDRSP